MNWILWHYRSKCIANLYFLRKIKPPIVPMTVHESPIKILLDYSIRPRIFMTKSRLMKYLRVKNLKTNFWMRRVANE